MRALPKGKEDCLQVSCVTWFSLQYPDHARLLHHSPNGGSRNSIEAAKFKRMGVQPGFPDLFLAVPSSGYHGLFVELKVGRGVQSAFQKEMEILLKEQGYQYTVVRSIEKFIEVIQNYLRDE